ncbi:MAG: efflux RND transporter periplasmic adaptor subunit [Rhodospirillales bacterium]|jgi:multidrug efflux system membrane fusion protein|nr:efflux RND transporter periplasmic adaptor subunit [Rhodospirillales bacterium]
MKRSFLVAATLALGVAGWIMSGQFGGSEVQPSQSVVGASSTPSMFEVQVRTVVARERTKEIVLFASTEADRAVQVRAETAGRVTTLGAAKGDRVKRGDIIVRFAVEDREARLAEAEANLAHYTLAYDATRKLSEQEFRSRVQLAEARSRLEAANAVLAAIRNDIEHTVVRAPFNGIIEDLPVEIGDYLGIGESVGRIVDFDPVLIVAEVSEREVGLVKKGSPARARLVTGQEVAGTVRYVSRVGTVPTRTFRVEVAADNPALTIGEGLTAELWLTTGRVRAHRVSPAVLTLSEDGVLGIKIVGPADRIVFHPVDIVADTPDGVWLAGLPERVDVVTVGHEFVRAGQIVKPRFEEISPPGAGSDGDGTVRSPEGSGAAS